MRYMVVDDSLSWISERKQLGRATPLRVDYFLTQSNLGACGQLAKCACELPTTRERTFDMLTTFRMLNFILYSQDNLVIIMCTHYESRQCQLAKASSLRLAYQCLPYCLVLCAVSVNCGIFTGLIQVCDSSIITMSNDSAQSVACLLSYT